MNVEVLIYIYMAICLSLIVFNCASIVVNRRRRRKLRTRNRHLEPKIRAQLARVAQGKPVEKAHLRFMARKLKRIVNLMSFDESMEKLQAENRTLTDGYLRDLYPCIMQLAMVYCERDMMKATYFAYLVKKYAMAKKGSFDVLAEDMLELVKLPSVYCRENALAVLYFIGNPDLVVRALTVLDQNNVFHHSKLIHDGLMTYAGDKEKLIDALLKRFDTFSPAMQVTLVNFMRLCSGAHCAQVLSLLLKPGQEDELCFACIRYFGRYAYEPAYPLLLEEVLTEGKRRWEYAAIAAMALRSYKNERTITVLMDALHSGNWYVRNNAAASLESMGMTYVDLIKVFDGNDRYAREMLQYWLDYRAARDAEEGMGA